MNRVLLIGDKILKENSFVSDNVDSGIISKAIYTAQEIDLQRTLGTDLYKYIQGLVEDGTITDVVNEKYKYLLDNYIVNSLIYKTMSNIQIPLSYKFKNSGIVEHNDDKHTNVPLQDLHYLVKEYDNQAQYFFKRLADYLCEHSSDYPQYSTNSGSDIKPDLDPYNVGILVI